MIEIPLPRGRGVKARTVFGSGRYGRTTLIETAVGIGSPVSFTGFRRTERDRKPPRRVLTGLLLGDPAPDRKVPEIPPETGSGVTEPPKPIFLTFREMHAYYGDQETE